MPERIDGGGYGFGHQVLHDDRFGTIVGHSGGLPGYGSNMRWLPGRRIGAVALANSTYAPMRLLTRRMLELLDDHGLVPSADAAGHRARRVSAVPGASADGTRRVIVAEQSEHPSGSHGIGPVRRVGQGHCPIRRRAAGDCSSRTQEPAAVADDVPTGRPGGLVPEPVPPPSMRSGT